MQWWILSYTARLLAFVIPYNSSRRELSGFCLFSMYHLKHDKSKLRVKTYAVYVSNDLLLSFNAGASKSTSTYSRKYLLSQLENSPDISVTTSTHLTVSQCTMLVSKVRSVYQLAISNAFFLHLSELSNTCDPVAMSTFIKRDLMPMLQNSAAAPTIRFVCNDPQWRLIFPYYGTLIHEPLPLFYSP